MSCGASNDETVLALHKDCIVCLARTCDHTAAEESVLILAMVWSGTADFESIHRDLCFVHRREVEDIGKNIVIEDSAG